MTVERRIPSSRLERLSRLGRLAGGIVGGVVSEGARQFAQGKRPSLNDLVLTPSNARRLKDRMSELRGAAMKVGQLLSMDSGNLLPPEFSEILAGLRESAHHMPLGQVAEVLEQAWGEGWDGQFRRFLFTPRAAASIGQVHEAELKDGRRIAIKIQYPGIRQSIDSDVDNVAAMLRMFKLVPDGFDIGFLLEEAKRQLHMEADYRQEAEAMRRYAANLEGDSRFAVPAVLDAMTTTEVLTMQYMDGEPIESLASLPEEQRERAAADLLELGIREIFQWGLVQTDPNFANYRYQPETGRIELLDFGATRVYGKAQRSALRALMAACVEGGDADIARTAAAVGYLGEGDPAGYREGIIRLLRTATEPVRTHDRFAFGGSDLASRMSDIVVEMRLRNRYGRMPPVDILFLHRKLAGLYLLLSRLQATLPVRDLFARSGVVL